MTDYQRINFRFSGVGVALCAACLTAGVAAAALIERRAPLFVAAAIGVYLLFAIQVADQWEKVAVLRLGRYVGLKGPGVFLIIPIVDTLSRYVDQRVRVTTVSAESTLTRDTVPVNVDAIIFWMVWDAKKAVLEVENYYRAIVMSAQAALRDTIGTHTLHEMLTQRELLGKRLQEVLETKTTPWGITIQTVEIRDV